MRNHRIREILARTYEVFTGTKLGQHGFEFVRNIGWTSFATFGSGLVTFVFTALAARKIGVGEYGLLNLVFSIQFLLLTFYGFGIFSAVEKYVASVAQDEKKEILGTGFVALTVISVVFGALFLSTTPWWSHLLKVDISLAVVAVGYTFIVCYHTFLTVVFRGLGYFKAQAIIHFTSAVIYVFSLWGFVFAKSAPSYLNFLVPVSLRWIFIASVAAAILFKRFGFSWVFMFRFARWKNLYRYGIYVVLGASAGGFLGTFDRLVLNHFLGPESVAIYSAYGAASAVLVAKLVGVLQAVFFPTMSARTDHARIALVMRRFAPLVFFTLILIGGVSTVVGLFLYGREYTFDLSYLVLFSVSTATSAIAGLFFALVASHSEKGARFIATRYTIGAGIDIVMNLLTVPFLGIVGAIGTTLVEHIYFYWSASRYFGETSTETPGMSLRVILKQSLRGFPRLTKFLRFLADVPFTSTAFFSFVMKIRAFSNPSAGFHGDRLWQEAVRRMLSRLSISAVVETGTFRGDTAAFFAEHFSGPIFSCEIRQRYYWESKVRLGHYPHAKVIRGNSPTVLRKLLQERKLGKLPLFFFDAHWYDYWPIQDELKELASLSKAIIMIDDFEVCGKEWFAYDVYWEGKRMLKNNLEFIKPMLGNSYHIVFPSYAPPRETGTSPAVLRGYVVLFKNFSEEEWNKAKAIFPLQHFAEFDLARNVYVS